MDKWNEPTSSSSNVYRTISQPIDSLCAIVRYNRSFVDVDSFTLTLADLITTQPSDSNENECVVQYKELSRFNLPKPCGGPLKDHSRYIRDHLGNLNLQLKHRIRTDLHFDRAKKSPRSYATGIVRTCICREESNFDDVFETENDAGFIAYLQVPICPSSVLSITLLPASFERWNQMSVLRLQQLKRQLIGRIIPDTNGVSSKIETIFLDVSEYDLNIQTIQNHSFLVNHSSTHRLEGSTYSFFHIILPSTHISFLPPESSEKLDRESECNIEGETPYITKATQTLLDTVTSLRLSLSKGNSNSHLKGQYLGATEYKVARNTSINMDMGSLIPRAFIFTGPPGGGKTFSVQMAVKIINNATRLMSVRGSELLASGQPSRGLISTFQSALSYCHENKDTVAIIFMDEFDALLSSDDLGHLLGAILDQMSSLVNFDLLGKKDDFSQAWRQIIVVAATNKIDTVPNYLRRPGRFDQEISVNAPDTFARSVILKSLLLPYRFSCHQEDNKLPNQRNRVHRDLVGTESYTESRIPYANQGHLQVSSDQMLGDDYNLTQRDLLNFKTEKMNSKNNITVSAYDDTSGLSMIAEACVGYVPADLTSLVRKAASLAAESESGILNTIHLERAMNDVTASALRAAAAATMPKTSWDDIIGDLGGAKTALIRAVEWPRTKKKAFASLGLVPPRGILLYGPPGCAKTSLARAAAGATGIAFFSLSPADVYSSSYVGDAEAVIRRTFSLARSASPCILFFDEIDAIIGCSSAFSGDDSGLASLRRGSGDGGSDAELRVLSTFLNEMDGIDGSVEDGVLIFAATNRPHTLDAALLRPGRFDKVIYVPPPDKTGRRMILEAQCKKWGNWSEFDLDYLASDSVSANMTGAELVGACREAAMMAIRDALTFEGLSEALEPRVTNQHLESAMGNIKPLLADPQVMIPFLTFQSQV